MKGNYDTHKLYIEHDSVGFSAFVIRHYSINSSDNAFIEHIDVYALRRWSKNIPSEMMGCTM